MHRHVGSKAMGVRVRDGGIDTIPANASRRFEEKNLRIQVLLHIYSPKRSKTTLIGFEPMPAKHRDGSNPDGGDARVGSGLNQVASTRAATPNALPSPLPAWTPSLPAPLFRSPNTLPSPSASVDAISPSSKVGVQQTICWWSGEVNFDFRHMNPPSVAQRARQPAQWAPWVLS